MWLCRGSCGLRRERRFEGESASDRLSFNHSNLPLQPGYTYGEVQVPCSPNRSISLRILTKCVNRLEGSAHVARCAWSPVQPCELLRRSLFNIQLMPGELVK